MRIPLAPVPHRQRDTFCTEIGLAFCVLFALGQILNTAVSLNANDLFMRLSSVRSAFMALGTQVLNAASTVSHGISCSCFTLICWSNRSKCSVRFGMVTAAVAAFYPCSSC